jgi:hypothetical protein
MANFTAFSGLYRVWVPLRDDGKSPLISIWIDPSLQAFQSRAEDKGAALVAIHRENSTTVADLTDADSNFPRACKSPGTERRGI